MRNVLLILAAAAVLAVAQDKPADAAQANPPQKVAKNDREAELITAAAKEGDAGKRLTELDQWAKEFPDTAFFDERQQLFLLTYQQLNKPREAVDKAKEILAKKPDDFLSLSTIIGYLTALNNGNPSPADMDTALQACNHVLSAQDAIFADSNKPTTLNPAQWATMKPIMVPLAQKTIGIIYFQRKDYARAEAELVKTLKLDATQAQASMLLANALFSQRQADPKKQPPAIFEFARAGVYDGANALPAAVRQQNQGTFNKLYNAYHGSAEGADKVLELAKTNALPPDDFSIRSTADIASEKAAAQAAADAANPMIALWRTIREQLVGDNGPAYFKASVEGSGLPGGANGVNKFKGKIVSMTPENRPKEIVLAVEKPGVADVTLKFEAALPGNMKAGEELEFEGAPTAFQKDPYMLSFDVEKDKLVGWTGKNAPPTRQKKKAN